MNFKVISTETIADTRLASLKGKISVLNTGLNIFTGGEANQTIDDLLAAKEAGINLRELFSKIKGLEFLAFESKPVIDRSNSSTEKVTTAQKSIYTCLAKLKGDNCHLILKALARDFAVIGFTPYSYVALEENYKSDRVKQAVRVGDTDKLRKLIGENADINGTETGKVNAIQYAVIKNGLDCQYILIEAGADIDIVTTISGRSLLHLAAHNDRDQALEKLLPLFTDIDIKDNSDETPLMTAVDKGFEKCVKLLIDAGADVNASTSRYEDQTPLMIAAKNSDSVITNMLLDAGASAILTDAKGNSALDWASYGGDLNLMSRIVAKMTRERINGN